MGVSQLFISTKKDSTKLIMASESEEELKLRLLVSLHLFTILVVACVTDSLSCRLCCMYYLIANQNTRSLLIAVVSSCNLYWDYVMLNV